MSIPCGRPAARTRGHASRHRTRIQHQCIGRAESIQRLVSRPLGRETEKVATWFASMTSGYQRCTGMIQAMNAQGTVIAEWSLYDVVPVRWTGPVLNPDQPKVVMETVEIAHHGFLPSA